MRRKRLLLGCSIRPGRLSGIGKFHARPTQTEGTIIRARIIVPSDYVGPCMELSDAKRGALVGIEHPDDKRSILVYDLPLAEMITDFYDRLKSVSRGYASMDYEMNGYRTGDLVKVDILVNNGIVDALSYIAPKESASTRARPLSTSSVKSFPGTYLIYLFGTPSAPKLSPVRIFSL